MLGRTACSVALNHPWAGVNPHTFDGECESRLLTAKPLENERCSPLLGWVPSAKSSEVGAVA